MHHVITNPFSVQRYLYFIWNFGSQYADINWYTEKVWHYWLKMPQGLAGRQPWKDLNNRSHWCQDTREKSILQWWESCQSDTWQSQPPSWLWYRDRGKETPQTKSATSTQGVGVLQHPTQFGMLQHFLDIFAIRFCNIFLKVF